MVMWYVKFTELLPFGEEIRRRCRAYEDTEEGACEQNRCRKAEWMRSYRISGRLALTWGWFLEKLTTYGREMRTPQVYEAERLIFAIADTVWTENMDAVLQEIQNGADQFLTLLEEHFPDRKHDRDSVFGKIYRYSPFFWSVLTENVRMKEALMKFYPAEWFTLQNWLLLHKGKTCTKEILERMCRDVKGGSLNSEKVLFLEQYISEQPYRIRFAENILIGYCRWTAGRETEKELCKTYTEIAGRLAQKGENLIRILFRIGNRNRIPLREVMEPVFHLQGGSGEIDLADLEAYLEDFSPTIRTEWKKWTNHLNADFFIQPILWAVRTLNVTDRTQENIFALQMILMKYLSEDELLQMRKRGIFPKRTLHGVIREALKREETEKLPLLIQWLHEDTDTEQEK